MRLCDWFAGIDINDGEIIAAIGSSHDGSTARVHGSRSFQFENHLGRDKALREIGEWFRLESGGNLSTVAFTVPGSAYRPRSSTGECRISEPEIVDEELVEVVRQRALMQAGLSGPVLCSAERGFVCDGRSFPEAPLGLSVRTLVAHMMNWIADPSYVESMSTLLDDIGFAPGLIVPRVVALAETTLTPRERSQGAVMLCVSEQMTEVAVYRDGQLADLFTVPLGKARLDEKVSVACSVPLDLARRIDLCRMLESASSDAVVQRVRTIVSAWNLSLMRAIRDGLDASGPVWQLRAGIAIADSMRTFALLSEAASRVIGVPARVYGASQATFGPGRGEPLVVQGLVPLQRELRVTTGDSLLSPLMADSVFAADERDGRRGIGPAISRWLREFVPADHAP